MGSLLFAYFACFAVPSASADEAPAITVQPTNQTVALGATATFSVTATGTEPLGYQWLFNGTNLAEGGRISGSPTASLTISNVQTSDAGLYSLVVTNAFGSVTSAPASLIVETCVAPPAGIVAWWLGDGCVFDIVGTNHGTLAACRT